MSIIYLAICFFASLIGAICGIGGGVIIKPVLDAVGEMNVSTISFLSGCTVLSMSAYSVLKERISGNSQLDAKRGIPIAVGAALGGLLGKILFSYAVSTCANLNNVGVIQAIALLLITLGTLVFTINKQKIKTYNIEKILCCILVGTILGVISSFLGIGGGPINLVVLFFFFSMPTKVAAETSICVILISQIASLITSCITKSVPSFALAVLIIMVLGGILGGIVGRAVNKKIDELIVDKLFVKAMMVIIMINVYNIYKFL